MPEGPELHLAAIFVNKACCGRIFSGKVLKSAVSTRNPEVDWDEKEYTISASARGKELKITLTSKAKHLDVILRFGMSGKFAFGSVDDMQKHSHLNFYTKTEEKVLSFVDYRRFGKWEPGGSWGSDRGPCVITEYEAFRENVLENLEKSAFNRPICEAMLNQSFFNGIGNYLRAEILLRCHVAPFTCARDVLEPLKSGVKNETPDLLELCNLLPHEVLKLRHDPEEGDDHSSFNDWLQCYYNPQMKSLADHNNRTIWFQGHPGPMAPKG
ncbi:hypothetical protein CAPTEDRAFT_110153 [Capitella teleta]|uniref:Formamidopyrimidine-DNA glycosylase catalytic domain-containing protein n=1 Tax=Capitella teleta TaxID=283909 RepID=R7VAR0_CAPTE|nr:hypothetical protein CAPTEDRAFT_110153 [Capitella teleta]|eukprot:ELU15622.1 hypothetical protein CAPTEDRAFT_110153 [Capitella teleta]